MSSSQSPESSLPLIDDSAAEVAESSNPSSAEPGSKESSQKKASKTSSKTGTAAAVDPFDRLEAQVRLAIAEIERLRRVNEELRGEVADLAAVARRDDESAPDGPEKTDTETATWQTERAEIRERVEGIVSGLEQMLILAEEE